MVSCWYAQSHAGMRPYQSVTRSRLRARHSARVPWTADGCSWPQTNLRPDSAMVVIARSTA